MQETIDVTIAHDDATGKPAVVTMAGELDFSNSGVVRSRLDELSTSSDNVILDIRGLQFIDSTGLGAIVRLGKQLKERSGALAIVVTKPSIRKLFAITALDKWFAIHDNIEEVTF